MTTSSIKLFISYSHRDEKLCRDLQKHLSPLITAKIIDSWYDRIIEPGLKWHNEIEETLHNSNIILFLLSKDFLSSSYINNIEVKIAMEMHNTGKAIVVPIMLRSCDLEYTPFKDIQGLPTDLQPITKWRIRDDAYLDIVSGIKKVVRRIFDQQEILSTEAKKWQPIIHKYKQNADLLSLELQIKERRLRHISMELHDDVGQRLSALKLYLTLLEEHTLGKEKIDSFIKEANQLASDLLISIRQMSHLIKEDVSKNDFNLKNELLELQKIIVDTNKIDLNLEFMDIESIANPQLEINLFRIIQELFNNIIRHAKASKAEIKLQNNGENVSLSVKDNGVGFDINDDMKFRGIGLSNVKNRVESYNGQIVFYSDANLGSEIAIRIPI